MFKIKFVMTKNEGLVEINIYLELDTLVKSQIVNMFGFVCCTISVATTQLYHWNMKYTMIINKEMNVAMFQ